MVDVYRIYVEYGCLWECDVCRCIDGLEVGVQVCVDVCRWLWSSFWSILSWSG